MQADATSFGPRLLLKIITRHFGWVASSLACAHFLLGEQCGSAMHTSRGEDNALGGAPPRSTYIHRFGWGRTERGPSPEFLICSVILLIRSWMPKLGKPHMNSASVNCFGHQLSNSDPRSADRSSGNLDFCGVPMCVDTALALLLSSVSKLLVSIRLYHTTSRLLRQRNMAVGSTIRTCHRIERSYPCALDYFCM